MRVADGVWAVGDVTGKGAFTHVGHVPGRRGRPVDVLGPAADPCADYRAVPRVTFTDPEVGAVGMTEQQAREESAWRCRTATGDLGARGWIHAEHDGVIKLVADAGAGCWSGPRWSAPRAGRCSPCSSPAVHAEVPLATLRSMIYAYPTFHRAVETVVDELAG